MTASSGPAVRLVQFWYELASPYSYPAAARIEGCAARSGVGIEWRPFLLGPIFAAQGWPDSPFNLYPAKGRYMWRDLERLCAAAGLPFRRPTAFPQNSVLAACVALIAADDGWCPAFSRAVFHAGFAEAADIGCAQTVAAIVARLGYDPGAVIARATAPESKKRLRRQTEAARGLGIFGSPTFVAGGELFWGNERLAAALRRAAGNVPHA